MEKKHQQGDTHKSHEEFKNVNDFQIQEVFVNIEKETAEVPTEFEQVFLERNRTTLKNLPLQ